jgi:hypothetical protein
MVTKDEGDDYNLWFANVRKTATALWFSSFKIIKHFRQTNFRSRNREKRKLMAKIRTEVFIETSEVLIIKRNRTFVRAWCEDCRREVSMLPLGEAARLSGHDVKTIRSMMENRHIHFCYLKPETPSVCLRSLCLF